MSDDGGSKTKVEWAGDHQQEGSLLVARNNKIIDQAQGGARGRIQDQGRWLRRTGYGEVKVSPKKNSTSSPK